MSRPSVFSEILTDENLQQTLTGFGIPQIGLRTILLFCIRIALVLGILFVAYFVCRLISQLILRSLLRLSFEHTVSAFLANLVQWSLFGLAVIACLSMFGIETTSFAAAVGGVSVALGLAFQGSLSNVAAGIMLLVFRPYKVGDEILVKDKTATVRSIELFFTIVDSSDNRRLFVPNKMVFNGIIENQTYHAQRRIDISVGVRYCDDLIKTREVLTKAIDLENVQNPKVSLDSMGAYSMNWVVSCWVKTSEFSAVKEKLIFSIKTHLDEAGIEIALPSQVNFLMDCSSISPT